MKDDGRIKNQFLSHSDINYILINNASCSIPGILYEYNYELALDDLTVELMSIDLFHTEGDSIIPIEEELVYFRERR